MRSLPLLVMLAGCRQLLGFEDPVAGVDAGPDAPPPQCRADQPNTCAGNTPVCGADNTCRGCVVHAECASNACLPSGGCAAQADVAYVALGGSGIQCTIDQPCADITTALGLDPSIIKVATGSYDSDKAITFLHDITVVADPGAAVRRTTSGVVVDIPGADDISISDLEIRDGQSSAGHGIQLGGNGELTMNRVKLLNNAGRGIDATMARTLTLHRCIFAGNISGGINVQDADFEITNSLIVRNGSAASNIGGLKIKTSSLTSRLAFDTIADNVSSDPSSGAIKCDLPFAARNDIMTGNTASSGCSFDSSLFDVAPISGTNNKAGNPAFANTDAANPTGDRFYRITQQSDAIDSADPAAAPADDIDGEPRPSGSAPDIGADELH